ncbi:MAG: Hint domain-containing protein [Sulfitobacter sp.]
MAVLNVDLLANDHVIVDQNNADSINVVNISALGNSTLTVDGVEVTIGSLASIVAGSTPTFEAINGGLITIDQGLLEAGALSGTTYKIGDDSTVHVEASTLDLGAVSNLINQDHNVEFVGQNHTGMFVYDPPTVSLLSSLSPISFDTTGMQATDMFVVEGKTLSLDTDWLGGPSTAYRNGLLHLETGGGLLTPKVHVTIPMSQDEFNMFLQNQDALLSNGTFIFPGSVVCFARGTFIRTDRGDVPIEDLSVGDHVQTRDNGYKPLAWIGSRKIGRKAMDLQPKFRPIRISSGSLGINTPSQDLLVSPQHRVLVCSKIAQRMFDCNEVLVAAKHLVRIDGIEVAMDVAEVQYFHILFDEHEIVMSNGAESESLYTGPEALKSVSKSSQSEILALFPSLLDLNIKPIPARFLVPGAKGKALAQRHVKNGRALIR